MKTTKFNLTWNDGNKQENILYETTASLSTVRKVVVDVQKLTDYNVDDVVAALDEIGCYTERVDTKENTIDF